MAKKDLHASKGKNVLNDEDERKKFKSALATITHYYNQQDDIKEGIKETIEELSGLYGLEKKVISKMAKTMYKSNYNDLVEENNHFEELYETVVEGNLRDDPVTEE
jgi:hypothetical protein